MGKQKRTWVNVDKTKGDSSEFDDLGIVEELADYNDEDLADIIAESNRNGDQPPKKKKKKIDKDIVETSEIKNPSNECDKDKALESETPLPERKTKDKGKKKKIKKKAKKTKKKQTEVNEKNQEEVKSSNENLNQDFSDTDVVIPTTKPDLIDIKDKWGNMGIHDEILHGLLDKKFMSPTEIQKKCIPRGIGFKDIVGAAETGSGKTLAFGIPLVANILSIKKAHLERNKRDSIGKLFGVVIAPTRELALQIQTHLKEITKHCDVAVCSLVGGLAPEKQERLLSRCPDIVIATPGRLLKMIESGNEHLEKISGIRFLVIDECDRMFEKGHFRELKNILEKMKLKDRKVQKYVFSATLSVEQSPKKQFYDDLCASISLDAKACVVDLTTRRITVEQLRQLKVICETNEKEIYLFHFLLTYPGRTIVFANTIACIDRLSRLLRVLELNPLLLHAKKQQKQRLQRLDAFKASKNGLLVCTDVAAHGLDIPEVDNVVHFQLPKDPKVYIHRSGRTARASKDGRTLIINGPEDFEAFRSISKVLKENEMESLHIESHLMRSLKERIVLAKDIERKMYNQQKSKSDAAWQKRVSKDIGIDADDSRIDAGDKKELKGKQTQLKRLLKTNPVANQKKEQMFSKSGTITISGIAL